MVGIVRSQQLEEQLGCGCLPEIFGGIMVGGRSCGFWVNIFCGRLTVLWVKMALGK